MKRFYSHFTFIYPDTYLKNYVIEMDNDNMIVDCFPFEKEIEKTEFYSGWLAFVPEGIQIDAELINIANTQFSLVSTISVSELNIAYNVFSIQEDIPTIKVL